MSLSSDPSKRGDVSNATPTGTPFGQFMWLLGAAAGAFIPTTPVVTATTVVTAVAQNAASVSISASDTALLGRTITNDSAATLYLLLHPAAASLTNYTVPIPPGGYYEVPFGYTNEIRGIWGAGGAGFAYVTTFKT